MKLVILLLYTANNDSIVIPVDCKAGIVDVFEFRSRVLRRESLSDSVTRRIRRERGALRYQNSDLVTRCTSRVMKRNESVKNENQLRAGRWRRIVRINGARNIHHPDEALMAPLTLRHELNDGGCFISERKLVSPISVRAGAVGLGRESADWARFNENVKAKMLYSRAQRLTRWSRETPSPFAILHSRDGYWRTGFPCIWIAGVCRMYIILVNRRLLDAQRFQFWN